MIADKLIDEFDKKLEEYFASSDLRTIDKDNWKTNYKKRIKQINHDESWLTLIACYSIFGNQKIIKKPQLVAINGILNSAGLGNRFNFTCISKVRVEVKLPEIREYRNYLKHIFEKDNLHLYPDRKKIIEDKLKNNNASFEGNTNLDLLIEGISNNKKTTIFIEAKFLSDISYQIKYNPVRDQIIRNIDCGIDYINNKKYAENFEDFYFMLLTPKMFRTKKFGKNKETELATIGATSSRLYCYKMNEYKNFRSLKELLPHRKLQNNEWATISENIGWLTFEDFWINSINNSTIKDNNEKNMIEEFFDNRNLK